MSAASLATSSIQAGSSDNSSNTIILDFMGQENLHEHEAIDAIVIFGTNLAKIIRRRTRCTPRHPRAAS